ncbi:unnamed protein product [Miscanthus lutarioriparius]|uniref:WRKY domain-containing protein n=1 Tax=Miscanthus lutarioriparius TaxID=422564 RepID=A0A811QID6_9POAL|nr:unnamed protein product [Miscanthus lutarioriparius]
MAVNRKTMERRKHQVRVSTEGGGDNNPSGDGHSRRKYDQKEILGEKSYYRCVHRPQGCNATKQVQRCDEDPTLFDVIYYGTHTCIQSTAGATAQQPECIQYKQSLTSSSSVVPTSSSLSDYASGSLKTTKRKTMERRKHQVRVRTEGGCDPPSGDGHSWRKYGQKEILGDKHPWLVFLFFPDPSKCLLMTFSVLKSGSKSFAFAFGFRRCGSPF